MTTLLCEVPVGAIVLVLVLATIGIAVVMYDIMEDIQKNIDTWLDNIERWWNKRNK